MQKKVLLYFSCAAVLCAAALCAYFFLFHGASERRITPEKRLSIQGVQLLVAVADTPQERERGLGGTTKLADSEGMLFIFEHDDQHSFWMKDMHYDIDIIWLSSGKRVVYIEKDVSPDTFPQVFTPSTRARYVLEVPAGFAERNGVTTGAGADF